MGLSQTGGTMRLITSPAKLSDGDFHTMGKGGGFKTNMRRDLQDAFDLAWNA